MHVRLDPLRFFGGKSNFLAIPGCKFNRGRHLPCHMSVEVYFGHFVTSLVGSRGDSCLPAACGKVSHCTTPLSMCVSLFHRRPIHRVTSGDRREVRLNLKTSNRYEQNDPCQTKIRKPPVCSQFSR